MRRRWRHVIGLGVPFLAVVPTIPLLARLDIFPWGVPVAVLWLFGCIPLTTLCLAACWFFHDRHQPAEDAPMLPEDGAGRRCPNNATMTAT